MTCPSGVTEYRRGDSLPLAQGLTVARSSPYHGQREEEVSPGFLASTTGAFATTRCER